jgi:dTDP-4-dehydrorhamnose 3,5-epimerase
MTKRLVISDTSIEGVKLVRRLRMEDQRGYLERLFCAEEVAAGGWMRPIAQVNRTYTLKAGTVRGMHFQHPPYADMKLVTCVRGAVFDVAVDLRARSPTMLRWHGEVLSAENGTSMLIPERCAHGMQALTPDVELVYLHTSAFRPDAEGGVNPLDPALDIAWPLPVGELSARDAGYKPLSVDYGGISS